ncbi:hypothetical protein HY643_00070 [Candidatus Woesearchaeota archaeon]|nr:hypothetical protein [Candidatus Woesearchaeota archaeon]
MEKAKLLKLRREIKKRKPHFVRQEANHRKKLPWKWKQPKGMHSKLRRKFRGRMKHPSPSFSSPKQVRGLHRTGLIPVVIKHLTELNGLNPQNVGVITSRTLGLRKKIDLLKKCLELKFDVLNIKDAEEFVRKVEEKRRKMKEETEKKVEVKEKAKQEALKIVEEKKKQEKIEEQKDDQQLPLQHETKKGQKSEKIKVLEKRD